MKKTLLTSLLVLSLSAAFRAAFAVPDVPLYDGKTLAQDNLSLSNWGGGSAEESTELFLFGGHALKVTTLDPYQGAKISFLTPVALTGSGRVFQVTLQRGGVTLHYVPQPVPGAAQDNPQYGPGGFQGGGFGGGGQGGGGRGRRRGGGGGGNQFGNPFGNRFGGRGGNAAPLIPLITKLRLEFTLADGRQADVSQAIPDTTDAIAGAGWYSVSVPLASLKFGAGGASMLKSVTLAGDQYGVFFIGRMQIAPEPDPSAKTAAPKAIEPTDPAEGDAAPPMGEQPGRPGREE